MLRQILSKHVFTCPRFLHQEHKFNINGYTINTIQIGDGEKSLMLLPGTMGTAWTDFRPQLEGLPELLPNHKIVAWDPPGYGKSTPPGRDSGLNCFFNDAKCAVNLMRALSRRQFSLLGWSAGGATALMIAGRFPEYVDKLVIWGTGAYLNEEDIKALEGFAITGPTWYMFVEALRDTKNWSEKMLKPLEEVYGKKRFNELLPKCIDCLKNFYEKRNGDICCKEILNIKAPTFILRGAKDPLNSPEHVQYLMDRIPWCKFHEFPYGKHNIHLRYSAEFNRMVAEFLLQKDDKSKTISKKDDYFDLTDFPWNLFNFKL